MVILSTHIVEDVSTLCNDMAIIGHGEVLLTGKPYDIETSLNGKVWEKQINPSELAIQKEKYAVISNHFHLGKMLITVVSEDMPDESFYQKSPNLEDAYFHLLFNQAKHQVS